MRSISRAALIAVVGLLVPAGAAEADTFMVNKLGDPAPGACTSSHCTLREAILRANNSSAGRDTIVLPNRRRSYEIQIANAVPGTNEDGAQTGDLDISNDPLAIRHGRRGVATVDGNDLDRVFDAFAPLTLKRVKVTDGDATVNTSGTDEGGGIRATARLALTRARVVGNVGDDGGGAIVSGAPVRIVRSLFAGNLDGDGGGGIQLDDAPASLISRTRIVRNRMVPAQDGGGVQLFNSTLTISRSTIADNTAQREGGGIDTSNATLRIRNSTISGNRANQTPLSDPPHGGGIYMDGGELTMVNSTVHGNSSDGSGGGIFTTTGAEVALNAVTIARNAASADDAGKPIIGGGGFYQGGSTFSIRNSIVGLNIVGQIQTRNDCGFGLTLPTSLGNNVLSTDGPNNACAGFNGPGDRVGVNPKLGALKRNGSPTKTVALKKGSPAIGRAHKPSAPNRDQRGLKRDRNPDSGAFERGA